MLSGNDEKFDGDAQVRRVGTPIEKIETHDLPSPLAKIDNSGIPSMPFTFCDQFTTFDKPSISRRKLR